jgi:hypothetical protein
LNKIKDWMGVGRAVFENEILAERLKAAAGRKTG